MAGKHGGTGSNGAESRSTKRPSTLEVDERLAPAVVEHDEPEREIVEQLVGDHDTVERLVGQAGTRLDTLGVAPRCGPDTSTAT